jgi:hypothetical protein
LEFGLEKNTTDKKLRRRQRNAFALLQAVLSYHPCFLAQRMTVPTALVRIKIQRTARKKSAKNTKENTEKNTER